MLRVPLSRLCCFALLVALTFSADPEVTKCAKHKDCPSKKDFCSVDGACIPCKKCVRNGISITGKCPCGPARGKGAQPGAKCTKHKDCVIKAFCSAKKVCELCRECKDHPVAVDGRCPCGPGKNNLAPGGKCTSTHDDCREQDFCDRSGHCRLCIQCEDDAQDAADGECPCGPALVRRVKQQCEDALKAAGCTGQPRTKCEDCGLMHKERLLDAGCTVPFVRKVCHRSATAGTGAEDPEASDELSNEL